MLLKDGSQFITRSAFELRLKEPSAPQDYSFEDYLSDSLDIGDYSQSAIIDALIYIIDGLQGKKA